MDIRQSKNYARYMESLGWIVESGIFIRKLPLLSFLSVIKVQRPSKIKLYEIEKVAKKYHAFMIKIEPIINFQFHPDQIGIKFRRDNWPLLPTKTIILDLKNINLPKDTRYEIRKAEKNDLVLKKDDTCQVSSFSDIEIFYKLLQETMKIGGWSIPIRKEVTNLYRSFQPNNSAILLCHSGLLPAGRQGDPESISIDSSIRWNDTPVAGCLLIWDGDTAHYMYAANTKLGREKSAAYFTLWKAIEFCQKKGLKYLDLEGIYDERYKSSTKNWQGFTKFKMGWGGKIVEYPGSYTKYYFFG